MTEGPLCVLLGTLLGRVVVASNLGRYGESGFCDPGSPVCPFLHGSPVIRDTPVAWQARGTRASCSAHQANIVDKFLWITVHISQTVSLVSPGPICSLNPTYVTRAAYRE